MRYVGESQIWIHFNDSILMDPRLSPPLWKELLPTMFSLSASAHHYIGLGLLDQSKIQLLESRKPV